MSDDVKIFVSIPCSSIKHTLCMQCFIHLEKQECPLCRFSFTHLIPDIKDNTKLNLIYLLSSQMTHPILSQTPREYTLVVQTNQESEASDGEVELQNNDSMI